MIKFHYPFRKADKTPFTDVNELYQELQKETSGHYLLGSYKFWHGGIHITDLSAPQCVRDDALCCIADGEVVAYRLNDDYRETTFGDAGPKLKYSNSFCLVRHEYASAPNPEEGANKDKRNKLTFYSLYMHLLPYQHYRLSPEEQPTPKVTMNVGDFYAYDVAPAAGPKPPACGKLSRDTKLEVLDQAENGNVTYAKGKIISGSVKDGASTTRDAGDEVWFAYLNNGAPYRNAAGQPIWTADSLPERVKPKYWKGIVTAKATQLLPLYNAPVNAIDGQPAGTRKGNAELCVTSEVKFDSRKVLTLMIDNQPQRMAECTKVSGGCWGPEPVPATFWTIVENEGPNKKVNWGEVAPQGFDEVICVGTAIKAGDPVGYLGYIENIKNEQGEIESNYQAHVELFTTDTQVKDFLQNAAGLKTGEQYLHLPSETVLKKKAPATDSLSLTKKHVIDLRAAPIIQDGGEDYYDVSVVENGQTISGGLKKTDATIITQHDREKLGFEIVEESNAMADGFVDPEDMPQFFKDLFAQIDTDGDKTAEPDELKAAMMNPAMRDQWARLVAYHPTEWKERADSPKWSRLDQLFPTIPKTVKHEKERIDNFVFWDQLSGRAQMASSLIWHFHPIEFISNMSVTKSCTCNAIVKVTRWPTSTMVHYGPLHTGDRNLGEAPEWGEMISEGKVTENEKTIIVVMSANEAKLNGVQSYDGEIITAGAMQKTINITGGGELPAQIKKFKDQHPIAFVELFESNGWRLDETSSSPKMFYQGDARANGAKLEGESLKNNLKIGCSDATFGRVVDCQPVAVMACAMSNPLYVKIQITDFIDRLHSALGKKPTGYNFTANTFFKTLLGKAVVLDHDINRPSYVKDDLGSALDTFFAQNPTVNRNINTWGDAYDIYENKVLELYGVGRRMTNASVRYNHLKAGF
ncbi:calcium-binding protein [Pseudomonas sp. NPDC098747]|uniref:calcium-binding protein n=1 Tax=Pseudomonas sp. NPDC098747 TaxID=3364487 RepID=UPI00383BDAA2